MTIGSMLAVLAILQVAPPQAKAAQPGIAPSASASAPTPTPSAAGMRIAATLASEAIVRKATGRILRDQVPKAFAKDPDFQKMEQSFPGITNEFLDVMEPIVVTATIKRLPIYQAKVAALFDLRMNAAELNTTADFYESPTGKRVVALAIEGLDFGPILKRQLETSGNTDIAPREIGRAAEAAVGPAIDQLNPSEIKVLVAFGSSPAGQKVNQMRAEIAQLAAEENNRSDPAVDAQIAEAIDALIKKRVNAKTKK